MSDERRAARLRLHALALVPTAVAAWACLASGLSRADTPGALIGKAGAVEIGEADVRRLVTALPEATRGAVLADPAALEQLVRGELARRLVLAQAKASAFDKDPSATAEFDRLRDDALVRLWVERQTRVPDGYPSEDELKRAYESAKERLGSTSEYHVAQIFLAAADGAASDKVAAALRKSAELQAKLPAGDFAALARSYSEQAETAAKGGDLGFLPESRLLPELRVVLGTLKVGEVTGPLKTAQGLHFVRLIEKRPIPAPSLAEVRANLVAALRQQRAAELQQRYLGELTAKSPVSVNQVELGRLKAGLK